MDEQTRGFRSAIFGGFNREDVLHYIEETDTKYYTETAELRSQLTEAQSAMNELRTQNEALTAKNAELLERLGEMTIKSAHSWTRSKAVFPFRRPRSRRRTPVRRSLRRKTTG